MRTFSSIAGRAIMGEKYYTHPSFFRKGTGAMPHQKKQFQRNESNAGLKVVIILGVLIIGVLIVNHIVNMQLENEAETAFQTAVHRLEVTAGRCTVLAGNLQFSEALSELTGFQKKHAQFTGRDEIKTKIAAVTESIETKRNEKFQKDWLQYREAEAEENLALCRKITEDIRSYGKEEQIQQAERSLYLLEEKTEEYGKALEALEKAGRKAFTDAEALDFSAALRELMFVKKRYPELARKKLFARRYTETREAIEQQRTEQFKKDWEKFQQAEKLDRTSTCQAVKEQVEEYGTPEQVDKITERWEKVLAQQTLVMQNPEKPQEQEKPAEEHTSTQGHVSEKPAKATGEKSEPRPQDKQEDSLSVSRSALERYLREAEKNWRSTIDDPDRSAVSATVTLIPDSLEYLLAQKTIELMDKSLEGEKLVRMLKLFVQKNLTKRHCPILRISLATKNGYSLFFDKRKDLHNYVNVSYGKSKAYTSLLETDAMPQYRRWEVISKERNQVQPVSALLWRFEGTLTLSLNIIKRWQKGILNVEIAGILRCKPFQPGSMSWEGWNPERGKLQYYRRRPIALKSSMASFSHDLINNKKVALPADLQQLLDR